MAQRTHPAGALGIAEQQKPLSFVPRGTIIEDQPPSLVLATQTDIEFGPVSEFRISPWKPESGPSRSDAHLRRTWTSGRCDGIVGLGCSNCQHEHQRRTYAKGPQLRWTPPAAEASFPTFWIGLSAFRSEALLGSPAVSAPTLRGCFASGQ